MFLATRPRLYDDTASHPEYATPECDDVRKLVTHGKAGERIVEGLVADAQQRIREVGGTVTGEHGGGIEKVTQMCRPVRPAELAQFHPVKAAFDPEGLLNPGKMVPTLHRCAEYGAMRVKGGALPHPDLPRSARLPTSG